VFVELAAPEACEGSAGTPSGSMAMPYSPQIAVVADWPACKTESNHLEIASEKAEIAEESAKWGRASPAAAHDGAEPRNNNMARTRDPFDFLDIA
jgi:hypothetical protein